MKIRLSIPEKILFLSISFTVALIAVRALHSHSRAYIFYLWNLFLAIIPLYFSRKLNKHQTMGWKAIVLITLWLLFFPNAPYLLTDIFHFYKRSSAPLWYDLILVFSATWNGLMAGFISLMQVDNFLSRLVTKRWRIAFVSVFMFAASDGIYLGRFLRFNSWDVVTKPGSIVQFAFEYLFLPQQHLKAWVFSIICTTLLLLIYYTIKNLPALLVTGRQ